MLIFSEVGKNKKTVLIPLNIPHFMCLTERVYTISSNLGKRIMGNTLTSLGRLAVLSTIPRLETGEVE